jgi:hypothetical protein
VGWRGLHIFEWGELPSALPYLYAVKTDVADANHNERLKPIATNEQAALPQLFVEVLRSIGSLITVVEQTYGIAICRILETYKFSI